MKPHALAAAALVAAAVVAVPRSAKAEIGLGLFVGEPLGLTLKVDLQRRSAIEVLIGQTSYRDGRSGYGHVTFLLTPFAARGRSVIVPFRIGIGGAIYDEGGDFGNDVNLAARFPFQVAFRFRSAPVELYFEIALLLEFLDANDNNDILDVDGGIGFRFYF
jgi:hypothetical protein